jgi:hypothetical protein
MRSNSPKQAELNEKGEGKVRVVYDTRGVLNQIEIE